MYHDARSSECQNIRFRLSVFHSYPCNLPPLPNITPDMRGYTCVKYTVWDRKSASDRTRNGRSEKKCFVPDSLNVVAMAQPLVFRYGSFKTVSGVAQKASVRTVPREWRMVISVIVVILLDLSPGDATLWKEVSRYRVSLCLQCPWCVDILTWNVFWVLLQGFVNCLSLQRLRNYFTHPMYELCVNTNNHSFFKARSQKLRKATTSFQNIFRFIKKTKTELVGPCWTHGRR